MEFDLLLLYTPIKHGLLWHLSPDVTNGIWVKKWQDLPQSKMEKTCLIIKFFMRTNVLVWWGFVKNWSVWRFGVQASYLANGPLIFCNSYDRLEYTSSRCNALYQCLIFLACIYVPIFTCINFYKLFIQIHLNTILYFLLHFHELIFCIQLSSEKVIVLKIKQGRTFPGLQLFIILLYYIYWWVITFLFYF